MTTTSNRVQKFLRAVFAIIVSISAPTNAQTNEACFPDKTTLQNAVRDYIDQSCKTNSTCAVGKTWGWPINTWCTKLVTDMSWLFYNKGSFNEDISGWDVGLVTTMSFMFNNAYAFNQDISGWDVGLVTSMEYMFGNASAFNQDTSGWDVGTVTHMGGMFEYASSFNRVISG